MRVLIPFAFSVSLFLLLVMAYGSVSRRRGQRPSPDIQAGHHRPGAGAIDVLITRAGRAGDISVRSVEIVRGIAMFMLPLIALPLVGLLPGRLGLLVVAALAVLGFLAPNLLLERVARRRREHIVSSLPDALDLLAVQVGSGRALGAALADLARSGKGPLAVELGIVADEMARGAPQSVALEGLHHRTAAREIAAFRATVERSRMLGSPLAEELRRQASAARIEQGRAVSERAARAAPKIQLVIALVLVPAVMLLVVAALVANSDRLLGFAFG